MKDTPDIHRAPARIDFDAIDPSCHKWQARLTADYYTERHDGNIEVFERATGEHVGKLRHIEEPSRVFDSRERAERHISSHPLGHCLQPVGFVAFILPEYWDAVGYSPKGAP